MSFFLKCYGQLLKVLMYTCCSNYSYNVKYLHTYFSVSLSLVEVKRWKYGAMTEITDVTMDIHALLRVRAVAMCSVWTQFHLTRWQLVDIIGFSKRCLSNRHITCTVKPAINQSQLQLVQHLLNKFSEAPAMTSCSKSNFKAMFSQICKRLTKSHPHLSRNKLRSMDPVFNRQCTDNWLSILCYNTHAHTGNKFQYQQLQSYTFYS